MSLSLGQKLRQAREERGISISEVAEQTRISPHYLESIENDDYKTLPGGIFNKGFLKSFAKYVGLDENEVLQDYASMTMTTEGQDSDDPKTYRPEVLTDDHAHNTSLTTVIFGGIILALIVGGAWLLVKYSQGDDDSALQANAASPTPAANSVPAADQPTPAPATDRINVELTAVNEPVWIEYTVDGSSKNQTLTAGEKLAVDARDAFRVSYAKAKANNLQITLNGRQITPPDANAKGRIVVDINKENLARVLESGSLSLNTGQTAEQQPAVEASPEPARSAATPAAAATPSRQRTAAATATRTPAAKPALKPTVIEVKPTPKPIVVGNPRPPTQ